MSDIPPDLAGKVLSADFRNLVKKVDGGILSAPERELLERMVVAGGQITKDLATARRAALLRKWALGARLTEQERAEIAPILRTTRHERTNSETYQARYQDYVARLQEAGMPAAKDPVRKIKSWVHRGRFTKEGAPRDPPDLPPLDDLSQMAAWWRRNMEWRVPDYLERLEKHQGTTPTPPPTGNHEPPRPAPGASEPMPAADNGIPDFDIDLNHQTSDIGINYIRGLVHSGIAEMNAARAAKDAKRYWNARRQFESDVETLRKWEKDLVKIQEGKGEVLRARVINEVFVRIFGVASQSFTQALLKLASQLAPQLPTEEVREIVMPLRDHVFSHLKTTRFGSVWQPGAAA